MSRFGRVWERKIKDVPRFKKVSVSLRGGYWDGIIAFLAFRKFSLYDIVIHSLFTKSIARFSSITAYCIEF